MNGIDLKIANYLELNFFVENEPITTQVAGINMSSAGMGDSDDEADASSEDEEDMSDEKDEEEAFVRGYNN